MKQTERALLPLLAGGAGGFGLAGMRERAQRIGAALEIDEKASEGTSVLPRLPIQPRGAPGVAL